MSSPPVPPKRWAQSDSDVGPVVQAVVRYAQNEGPSAARLESVRQGVLARSEPTRRARRTPLRAALWAAAVFVPVALIVVWVVVGAPLHEADPGLTVTKEPLVPLARKDPAPAPASEAASAVPTPAPSLPLNAPPKLAASTSGTPRRVESEIETLQRARRLLSEKPAEALLLTRHHATQNPRSEFTEEREALRIEALMRLGRQAEARRHYDSFAHDHPRSVYLRRMGPWFSSEEGARDATGGE